MSPKYAFVNALTIMRIALCPLIIGFVLSGEREFIAWVLFMAFITDAADGFLARLWKVTSPEGARIDSLADDFLFITACIVMIVQHDDVIFSNMAAIIGLALQQFIKLFMLWKFHRKIISGLHTYATKLAAFFQALFFIHAQFFTSSPVLFYIAVIFTGMAIGEEIIIIITRKEITPNYRGIFFNK